MNNTGGPQKTLIEQIHEELMASIETLDAFDAPTIEKLTKLIQTGELKKAKKVAEVILPPRKEEHETPRTGN